MKYKNGYRIEKVLKNHTLVYPPFESLVQFEPGKPRKDGTCQSRLVLTDRVSLAVIPCEHERLEGKARITKKSIQTQRKVNGSRKDGSIAFDISPEGIVSFECSKNKDKITHEVQVARANDLQFPDYSNAIPRFGDSPTFTLSLNPKRLFELACAIGAPTAVKMEMLFQAGDALLKPSGSIKMKEPGEDNCTVASTIKVTPVSSYISDLQGYPVSPGNDAVGYFMPRRDV